MTLQKTPKFAVVGHPNKGKSSIVATLSHNDGVDISDVSGTTTVAQNYPFVVDGVEQYVLVDTPGFQRPRQVLSWLEKNVSNAAERAAGVSRFIEEHKALSLRTGRFKDEIELLTPILEGAGIIYVVDGSVPYTPEYEAEMTILQWTGQARLALINPIGGEQYVDQWKQALGQFFSLVHVFNPMTGGVDKQLSILEAFAELNDQWRNAIERSIASIEQRFKTTHSQAAYIIAEAMAGLLSYQQSAPIVSEPLRPSIEAAAKKQYQVRLKRQEYVLRKNIVDLYAHYHLRCSEDQLVAEYPDMFDQDNWYLFGLSRQKLMALAVSAGAAAGALIDIGVGGTSLMTGALAGGLISGAASFFITAQPDRVRIKGIPLGGKKIIVGPVKNLQFAYVLLGRAIRYQQAIASRAHADQSLMILSSEEDKHWIDGLDKSQQIKLTRYLQKAAKGLSQSDLQSLQKIIARLL